MLNVNQRKRIGKENNFQIIRPKKEIGRNSFRFRGPVIWNLVADDTKNIKNKNTFKEKLKSMKDTGQVSKRGLLLIATRTLIFCNFEISCLYTNFKILL